MSDRPHSPEEALELFLECRRLGESTSPAEFAARYPELEPELSSALLALAALESTTNPPAQEDLPERIGAFRILREIGRGGMGLVLEAIEEPLGRRVALKVLPPERLGSSSARERFRREASLASRLEHPGIATVYGAGVEGERLWIAMRFVDGKTLSQAIAAAQRSGAVCAELPGSGGDARARLLALAACIARVARALHSAHEQGVVHRDLKPSNIIVAPDGSPVLLDFGLASTEEFENQQLTRTGEMAGTPAYLAPELLSGGRARPDVQCDVYSLGVTLYECIALRRPFDAPTPAGLYRAIVSSATPDLRRRRRGISRDLAVVVATAMERDPSRRYRSAAAFAADLEALVAGRPIAARPVPLHGRLLRWARREPRQAVLAGGLALATVAAAGLGGNWWASRDEVHAAAESARRNAFEDAIAEGFYEFGQLRHANAELAFTRAQKLDPHDLEVVVGRVLVGLDRHPRSEMRALLDSLPPETRGLDALAALVDHQPLPASATDGKFEGASALDLCVLGMCLLCDAARVQFSDRRTRNLQALHCFTEAILRAPVARPLYYEERAFAAQLVGDREAARSASAALLSLWPDSPRALYAAGRALCAGDLRGAIPVLERSIELAPRDLDAHNMLALALCGIGEAEAAESCCWRALAIDPGSANMLYWLGNAETRENCPDEARAALLQAVALSPGLAAAWGQIALIDLLQQDPASATRLYARALDLDRSSGRMRIFYAVALEQQGDLAGARSEFDQALADIFPDTADTWRTFAATFRFLHAPQSSLLAAEAGLALAPADAGLRELRTDAQSKLEGAR
jgi:tetratricopeptide (TPR) repeat protein/tRNA A-37 threonylcarbamoyl transferase component Bud32